MRKSCIIFIVILSSAIGASAQLKWTNVDSLYQPLPASVHIYFTDSHIDTASFRAYYLIADLKDKKLDFTVDTAHDRRLTPSIFYERNDKPLLVVNCTFFSYETNRSLNVVIKNQELVALNVEKFRKSMGDTTIIIPVYGSAIGINKKRKVDIAWIKTDSIKKSAMAIQEPKLARMYVERRTNRATGQTTTTKSPDSFQPWKMETAVGGGPVLLQNGEIKITNNEELKFAGKAINDKHPRTAMGYTKDGKLIILVIEGRNKNAGGATLTQEAQIFKDLGCWEALNLDGGGSSCMLVNGKETIKVSDALGQRPVPAVFIIKQR
jgi:exopolysaccharide biosynthesis protein